MLVTKTTWCFACDRGKMKRVYVAGAKERNVFTLLWCLSCGAEKRTYLVKTFSPPSPVCSYHWPDGREVFW